MRLYNCIFMQSSEAAKAAADDLLAKADAAKSALDGKSPDEILHTLMEAAVRFGLKLLAALAIFIIGAWLIKTIRKRVHKSLLQRKGQDTTLVTFIDSFVGMLLWILLIAISIGALGINTTSIAALLAAGGMAIGMALSGTLQNFAGGIMLLVFKPFKAGDFIEAQGHSGTVKSMNIVATTILTRDNRTVILPHGALANGNITNYSAQLVRRVEWTVNVPYGSDSTQVMNELMSILKADGRIVDSKAEHADDPFVGLSAMKDSSLEFTVRAWVKTEDYWAVFFDINNKIYTELPKKGINFPFPQMDVHISQQQ